MIKRAVVYLRVSTGKQVEGASLDTQELMCQNWATRNEVVVDHIFHDDGTSAKTLNRPAIQELLTYCAKNKGRISYLVTYQTDRLTRNAADFYALKIQLSKMGIEYKNVNSSIGENTASDELIQGIEAVIAQHDNRLKSDRVTENMKRHAQDGYRMSKAPHGLRNIRDVLGRSTVEAVPELADKIARLLNSYATGAYTIATLLELANEMGLNGKKGSPLQHQTLSKMLRQPLYAGLEQSKHTGGRLMKSQFDGIITPAVFYKNQDILRKNKNTAAKYKQLNPLFPLRRFAVCDSCGQPLRGSSPRDGSGKSSPRYHCTGCKSPSIAVDELHEQFLHLIASLKPTPEIEKFIKELIVRVWREEIRELNQNEKKLHRALEALRERKRLAIDKVVSGELTGDEKDGFITAIDEETGKINQKLVKVNSITKLKEDAIDYALRFIANAPHLWNTSGIDGQIIYQKLIFPEGIRYNLKTNNFGTVKTSALYTLVSIKKDAKAPSSTKMVTPRRVELLLPG